MIIMTEYKVESVVVLPLLTILPFSDGSTGMHSRRRGTPRLFKSHHY